MKLTAESTVFNDEKVQSKFSELIVDADGIRTEVGKKVGNDEVISRIRQSAEDVKIQASKIEIDGVINAINNNTSTTINGNKITTGTLSANAVNAQSGTFDSALIPNLSADKITTGTLDASRVNVTNINADDIVAGIISDANAKNTWNLNTGVFTTTSGTIGGFTITSQSGGRDYLMSDWTTGGIDYRTWIRSATDTAAGDTWAFSTQVKKSAGAEYKGSFYVTSRGELNCLPYTSAGNVSGISLRVHSDGISMAGGSGSTTPNFDLNSNGIFIYTGAVVSNQPNLFVDTSTNKLCYTKWTGSSEKNKKDIKKTIEYEDILPERLYDVEIVQFKYKDTVLDKDDPRSGKDLVGFLIEDLDEKYPVAVDKVNKKDSKTWSWNNAYLIPPMLKLIQDQKTKIDELESRLNKVEEANNGQRQIN